MRPQQSPLFNKLLFELGSLPYDLLTRHALWRDHCREMLANIPGGRTPRTILDLGCGPGVSAIQLRTISPHDRIVGLDLSGAMLRRARKHIDAAGLHDALPLVRGDALKLPFRDASAHAVTGHSFLYLLPNRGRALEEIRRVLRPDGVLVLLEPAAGFGARRLARYLGTPTFALTMTLWRLASGAAGRFTRSSLQALLEDAGFVDVRLEPALNGLGLLATARGTTREARDRPRHARA